MNGDRNGKNVQSHLFLRVLRSISNTLPALLLSCLLAWWLIPFANRQRGYVAVGGEWLLIFAVGVAAMKCERWLYRKKERQTKCRNRP